MRREYSSTECFCLNSVTTGKFFISLFRRRMVRRDCFRSFCFCDGMLAARASFMRAFSLRMTRAAESSTCVCSCILRRSASSSSAAASATCSVSRRTASSAASVSSRAWTREASCAMLRGLSLSRWRSQRRRSTLSRRSRLAMLCVSLRRCCSFIRNPMLRSQSYSCCPSNMTFSLRCSFVSRSWSRATVSRAGSTEGASDISAWSFSAKAHTQALKSEKTVSQAA
mmetsp:Transcript_2914/g.5628  ORF Transcript_2914/g.5628 Transcript_2914/m.5628 type:complete len:226 (-) Transcript_2914:315-992(-)